MRELTDTVDMRVVQPEARVTGTHEAAEGVGAVSVLTDPFVLLTLVYVLQHNLTHKENCNTYFLTHITRNNTVNRLRLGRG